MADVTGDDRGQLLLVAGLVIAITFVILVLVLNTVIYTENLGTRSNDVGGDDAVAYERAAVDHTATLLPFHVADPENDYETVKTSLSNDLSIWVDWSREHTFVNTNYVTVNITNSTPGTRILHTESERPFTSATGEENPDWKLVEGVEHTAKFEIRELPMAGEGGLANISNEEESPFRIEITDGNGSVYWYLEIYEKTDGESSIAVVRSNGVEENSCEIQEDSTIDLVAGTVDACEDIGSFTSAAGTGYSIEYKNPDNIEGQYELLVDVPRDEIKETGAYNNPENSDPLESPYTTPAVYYATVEVIYENDRLIYESTVDISPEGRRG